jgi:hypothetical protein
MAVEVLVISTLASGSSTWLKSNVFFANAATGGRHGGRTTSCGNEVVP